MRLSLIDSPTFGYVEPGRDAYCHTHDIRKLAKQYGRYWMFHRVPRTVALPDNCFAKSTHPFTDHCEDMNALAELVREYSSLGVPRPSGYADVFHERFRSPIVEWSLNSMLAPAFAGGWQDSIVTGRHVSATYRKYDMRSAYLWAASLGLPDVRTFRRSLRPWKRDGVYRLRLLEPKEGAPFPFNEHTEVLADTQEIETYGLRISEVLGGVSWEGSIDPEPLLTAIRLVSTWKQAGRCFWGRWAQSQPVTCVAGEREWELPNLAQNIPWAHTIVSRVKMRLWEYATDAVHVFVDSVITPHELPTGNNIGDWKLEKVYDGGVIIRGPGQYGSATSDTLERMAGVKRLSPLRAQIQK